MNILMLKQLHFAFVKRAESLLKLLMILKGKWELAKMDISR